MSERPPRPPHEVIATVPGEWAYVYACFMTLRKLIAPYPQHQIGRYLGGTGYRTTVYRSGPHDPIGTIEITGTSSETDIVAAPANPQNAEDVAYCQEIVKRLQGFASIRRGVAPTADEVIQLFYRQRAAGGKATLKDIAEELGLNYAALRKRKMAYDRAGGWGSKRSRVPDKSAKSNE